MNKDETLILRARIAAGCSWNGEDGGHGNQTEPQEPEVRRILRDCADRLVITNPNDGFVDTTCESCGCRVIVKQDDNVPLTLCPACGGGSVCAAFGIAVATSRLSGPRCGRCRERPNCDPKGCDGCTHNPVCPGCKPVAGTFRIVDTDNFGGDYPDEKVFIDEIPNKELADKICDSVCKRFVDDHSYRTFKVVDSDYVLQPGFEP